MVSLCLGTLWGNRALQSGAFNINLTPKNIRLVHLPGECLSSYTDTCFVVPNALSTLVLQESCLTLPHTKGTDNM